MMLTRVILHLSTLPWEDFLEILQATDGHLSSPQRFIHVNDVITDYGIRQVVSLDLDLLQTITELISL